jgi:hypothetical protein
MRGQLRSGRWVHSLPPLAATICSGDQAPLNP